MTKPCGSGDTVNGAVVQQQSMSLSGEICSTGGQRRPTAALAARPGAIRDVIGQKSAEAIVGTGATCGNGLKGRTQWDKEEP